MGAYFPVFTDTYIKVEHLNLDIGNSNTEGYTVDVGLAAVKVNIQPSSPEVTVLYNGAFGKSYTMFTTNSGILETDRVTTVSGSYTKVFIVKGKQYFNYSLGQHLELFLEELE